VELNRRSFLIGGGLTAAGLLGLTPNSTLPAAAGVVDSGPVAEPLGVCRPQDPLGQLLKGNQRFARAWRSQTTASAMDERADAMASLWTNHCYESPDALASGQAPWASVLSCADSRVSPEWIFSAAPSDLFVIRSAGNTAFSNAIGSLEFGVEHLGTPLIMVMGHSGCGAVTAARDHEPLTPNLEDLVTPIRASLRPGETLEAAIKTNARQCARQLTERSPLLAEAERSGTLSIVVSYFDIRSGDVTLL